MSIFTPVNNKTLTNIAVVRYKKGAFKFEIACYPSKVQSWRSKIEKDINEVIQVHRIFTNVSKGVVAKKDELSKAFGNERESDILLEILERGELQISSKERENQSDQKFKDIATIIYEKCVNSETKRPIPVSMIEKAMKDVHVSIHPTKTSKQQSLEVIRQISSIIPIQRAQMRLNISVSAKEAKSFNKEKLKPFIASIEDEDTDNGFSLLCLVDPGNFRKIDDLVKGKGFIEIMNLVVATDGDSKITLDQKPTEKSSTTTTTTTTKKQSKKPIDSDDEEEHSKTSKKQTLKKVESEDDEEEDEEEEEKPQPKKKPTPKKVQSEDEEEEEEEEEKPKSKKKPTPKKVESEDEDEEEEEEEKPKPKKKPTPKKVQSEDDDEDILPTKSKKSSKTTTTTTTKSKSTKPTSDDEDILPTKTKKGKGKGK